MSNESRESEIVLGGFIPTERMRHYLESFARQFPELAAWREGDNLIRYFVKDESKPTKHTQKLVQNWHEGYRVGARL